MYQFGLGSEDRFVAREHQVQIVGHRIARVARYRHGDSTRFTPQPNLLNDQLDQILKKLSHPLSGLIGVVERISDATHTLLDGVDNSVDLIGVQVVSFGALVNDCFLKPLEIGQECDEPFKCSLEIISRLKEQIGIQWARNPMAVCLVVLVEHVVVMRGGDNAGWLCLIDERQKGVA